MKYDLDLRSTSPEQTLAIGRMLAGHLVGGDLVALSGPLGAGKTQLVKGLAAGLGVPADEPVISPTFVLAREYLGRLKLYHVDAYRLSAETELWDLGWEEMRSEPNALVVIEWADRFPTAVSSDALWIELEHVGPTERRFRLALANGERAAGLARMLNP